MDTNSKKMKINKPEQRTDDDDECMVIDNNIIELISDTIDLYYSIRVQKKILYKSDKMRISDLSYLMATRGIVYADIDYLYDLITTDQWLFSTDYTNCKESRLIIKKLHKWMA